jgi:hypothetical protein
MSEIARLRQQIDQEYQATLSALYAYRATASHEVIDHYFSSFADVVLRRKDLTTELEGADAARIEFIQSMEVVEHAGGAVNQKTVAGIIDSNWDTTVQGDQEPGVQ